MTLLGRVEPDLASKWVRMLEGWSIAEAVNMCIVTIVTSFVYSTSDPAAVR